MSIAKHIFSLIGRVLIRAMAVIILIVVNLKFAANARPTKIFSDFTELLELFFRFLERVELTSWLCKALCKCLIQEFYMQPFCPLQSLISSSKCLVSHLVSSFQRDLFRFQVFLESLRTIQPYYFWVFLLAPLECSCFTKRFQVRLLFLLN